MEIFLAEGTVLVIYSLGLGVVVLLSVLLLIGTAWALKKYANSVAKELLSIRRMRFLRYWTTRLENEGLLPLDNYYRQISQGNQPVNLQQALDWQEEADRLEKEAQKQH